MEYFYHSSTLPLIYNIQLIEILITMPLNIIPKFKKELISSSSFIKHKLYSRLRPILIKPKRKLSRILCNKNFNSFYYTNYKPTQEQKEVSRRISEILCDEDSYNENSKVLWIQGNHGAPSPAGSRYDCGRP